MDIKQAEEVLKGLAGLLEANPSVRQIAATFLEHGTAKGAFRKAPMMDTRYRTLVEQIPAVIFMASLDGSISEAYVSPHIESVLGFSQAEWLDDPVRWYSQIHPDDKERWSCEAAEMIISGLPLRSVYRVLARDGQVISLQCDAKFVRDESGQPWLIHGLAVDITELKKTQDHLRKVHEDLRRYAKQVETVNSRLKSQIAEREVAQKNLRESEERFRLLVDGVRDYAIFMLNPEGYVMSWNQGAERLKGYSAEEIIGKHFSQFFLEEDIQRGIPEKNLTVAMTTGQYESEGWRRRKNGSKFWAHALLTALTDNAGQFRGFAKLTRDMTEQKSVQEKLQESERLAAMGTTAAVFAHEIGNPLNGISASLQFLRLHIRKVCDDALANEMLDLTLAEIDNLGSLLSDFRSLARPQNAELIDLRDVQLAELVNEIAASQKAKYADLRISIQQSVPANLPLVKADPRKLKQALLNLCNNAVEAMGEGGRLTLKGRYSDGFVFLDVADTGVGIPDDLDIFQLFKTTKARGTGLGLAVVRQVISAHQGTISYQSELGKGTTFTITLPVSAGDGQT